MEQGVAVEAQGKGGGVEEHHASHHAEREEDRARHHPFGLVRFFGDGRAGIEANEGPTGNSERRQKRGGWAGSGSRPETCEQFRELMLPEKEEQQQRDTERADDFRIDSQRNEKLKYRDMDQIKDGAN